MGDPAVRERAPKEKLEGKRAIGRRAPVLAPTFDPPGRKKSTDGDHFRRNDVRERTDGIRRGGKS
jgi:hypothetical protein